ncbi:Peptidyl-prolyl cis-trans isomerase CYP23 [Hibiscus syriacus]|uniref:Peptidyl-prolyl cis-trans isomerase CYP23 n=1 Tax=Hibiscus syriacus TaxID=106335 RepID=A0A6A2Y510_HIBSY|nr:Peptidyl-prolyl cis-trans isomerase CYP23 [Hibiscus syriacus]
MQKNYGDIEFGLYPSAAPKTITFLSLCILVAITPITSSEWTISSHEQRREVEKTIVVEFSDVKHVRGILSMGRYSYPDSAQSSFSILLGDAPHLDGQYAIFGKVTKGDETLRKLEELPTRS